MKVTCISDTHGLHDDVSIEPTDLLIFAGDSMNSGYNLGVLISFLKWFVKQPAKYRIMIAGNHDRWIENNPKEFRELLKEFDIIYLEDSEVIIKGLKIYGTPHQRHFCGWAFNKSEKSMKELFSKMPIDTDILVSHAPDYGRLDTLVDGLSVGELELSKVIKGLTNLKLHVFGHIHNGFGMIKPDGQAHISVNATQVDETYSLVNFPIKVEI